MITTLLCISGMVFVNQNLNVKADTEEENEIEGLGLDFDFMWEVAENLSNVIYTAYGVDDIPKGRAWGTLGDIWTADYIEDMMKSYKLNLQDVHQEEIDYLSDYPERKYSNKIVVKDFSISISHTNPNIHYEWETPVSISEIFPFPSGYKSSTFGEVTYNYSFDDVKVVPLFCESENRGENWPWGGSYNNYSLNVLCESLNNYGDLVVGNVSYLEANDPVPDFKDGMVFIVDDTNESQVHLEHIQTDSNQ